MSEPLWLTRQIIEAIHDEQLAIHGGPRNKWSYERAELDELAAAYAYGIARNHPFIDGNKRTSLLALYTFLGVNDIDFDVPEAEAATMILSLAAGEVGEEGLTRWIRDNWPKS